VNSANISKLSWVKIFGSDAKSEISYRPPNCYKSSRLLLVKRSYLFFVLVWQVVICLLLRKAQIIFYLKRNLSVRHK